VSYHQIAAGVFNFEYDTLGGPLRPLVGIQLGRIGVTDTPAPRRPAVQQETKLARQPVGQVLGLTALGQHSASASPTTAATTSPIRPGALPGVRERPPRGLGSELNYGQATLGLTGYTPFIPGYDKLTPSATSSGRPLGRRPVLAR
jgi:hypothetical protein